MLRHYQPPNPLIMDAIQRKELLHLRIEQANEEMQIVLSKMVEALFQTYQPEVIEQKEPEVEPIVGYEIDGTAITASRFVKEADAAVEAAKAGNSITVQELEKRSEEWLSRLR
jgi:hypothetical protein